MHKPEILGSARSSYTRVIRMVCEEKGIDYTLTETRLRAPELFTIHPLGKMPVLRHGDFALCESKAIATYLDRGFPGAQLIPSDLRLATLTEQWVSMVNTTFDNTLIRTYLFAYIAPKTVDGTPNRAVIDAVMPAVRQQLTILDNAVAQNGYLVGDQFTLADIFLLPILYYVQLLQEGAQALTAARHLTEYYDRHAARPSFKRTVPPSGPPPKV
jgi:glutathione S-transferase